MCPNFWPTPLVCRWRAARKSATGDPAPIPQHRAWWHRAGFAVGIFLADQAVISERVSVAARHRKIAPFGGPTCLGPFAPTSTF
eukprot:251863-Chlamydomonas_euryale.AAC.5